MISENRGRAQRYHRAIRTAVLNEWDPIGVQHSPEAQDEYDSYVSSIYKMLIAQRSRSDIFDYLWSLETVHMGLVGDRQATERFATRLIELARDMESDPQ